MEKVDSVALTILIDEIDAVERSIQKKEQRIDRLTRNSATLNRMIQNLGKRYVEDHPHYNPREDSLHYEAFLESDTGRLIRKAEQRIMDASFEAKGLRDQISRSYEELAILKKIHRKIKEETK